MFLLLATSQMKWGGQPMTPTLRWASQEPALQRWRLGGSILALVQFVIP